MRAHIDLPKPNQIYSGIVPVQGWILSEVKPSSVEIHVDGVLVAKLEVDEPRPDVVRTYPDLAVLNCGFSGLIYSNMFEDGPHVIELKMPEANVQPRQLGSFKVFFDTRIESIAHSYERILGIQIRRTSTQRRERLRRLQTLFQCPKCTSKKLLLRESHIECQTCHIVYDVDSNVPVFYTERRSSEPSGPVSSNSYPARFIDAIKNARGLVLDYGAGGKPYGYDNVIQVEIFRYFFTDVVVDREGGLPFRDNSFSVVLSDAVVEHVRRPWVYVDEIHRVLEPGGVALIDSAFLQPVHAYPDHFFNTTLSGLKELCKKFRVVKAGVDSYQEPWLSLVWLLEAYRDRLPAKEREAFLKLEVHELINYLRALKDGAEDKTGLKNIEPDKAQDIAAGVYVEARKTS
jgi:SAM-dependent methyltransferase